MALLGCGPKAMRLLSSWLAGYSCARADARAGTAAGPPDVEHHHDLLERAVAGPLADPVDGALDLAGARPHGGEGVGDGQAEVVVAVDADHRLRAGDCATSRATMRGELVRRAVADRVGDVDRAGAGRPRPPRDRAQVLDVRAGRRPRPRTRRRPRSGARGGPPATASSRTWAGVFAACVQVDVAGGDEGVDAGAVGALERRGRARDVGVAGAREAGDGDVARSRRRSLRTASKSPSEAMGKPASRTSTPRSASVAAIRRFSRTVMLQPGDCSPSRRVVSKIVTRSAMWLPPPGAPRLCRGGRYYANL